MVIKTIACSAEVASLALSQLPHEIRSAVIFSADGVEVPEEHEAAVAEAISAALLDLDVTLLAASKAVLVGQINAAAEGERLKYITPGEGQAMTYTEKLAQARAYLATAEPVDDDYPMLVNEVGVTADDVAGVAAAIMAAYTAWLSIGAAIEKVRMETNKAINDAADLEAAQAARASVVWPAAG